MTDKMPDRQWISFIKERAQNASKNGAHLTLPLYDVWQLLKLLNLRADAVPETKEDWQKKNLAAAIQRSRDYEQYRPKVPEENKAALDAVHSWFNSINYTAGKTTDKFKFVDGEKVMYEHGETIRRALQAPSRERKLREAFQDCLDNYIAVMCNEMQITPDEVAEDQVVKKWLDALAETK